MKGISISMLIFFHYFATVLPTLQNQLKEEWSFPDNLANCNQIDPILFNSFYLGDEHIGGTLTPLGISNL